MAKGFDVPKHKQQSAISKAIESVKINHDEYLTFSFKYYAEKPGKFSFGEKGIDYLYMLIDRLKGVSTMTVHAFYNNRTDALRAHKIEWDDVTEDSFGITHEEQIVSKPYQFQLTANEHGRVHGFIIGNIFFIRWLDPDHNLYP